MEGERVRVDLDVARLGVGNEDTGGAPAIAVSDPYFLRFIFKHTCR